MTTYLWNDIEIVSCAVGAICTSELSSELSSELTVFACYALIGMWKAFSSFRNSPDFEYGVMHLLFVDTILYTCHIEW